jgi:hypothetical protein
MATTFDTLLPIVRARLIEPVAKFWADSELFDIMYLGARSVWRDVVDLKGEHYMTVDITNVTLEAQATSFTGIPADVHKIIMIEPRDLTENGPNVGLVFKPLEYQNPVVQSARASLPADPQNMVVYYSIAGQGAPVSVPTIYTAPKVTSQVEIAFSYVPTLGALTNTDFLPIPGEADNAIIAWTVAYARAKEREDRSPDPAWIGVFATEKEHLLQSLGLRQYQEPSYAEGVFSEYWG